MTNVTKKMYKGKEILYVDYRGLNESHMIQALKQAESIILSENKPHFQLSNITDARATPEFMKAAKEFGKLT